MPADFDSAADSVFHQLYDHHLGWSDEWLDDLADDRVQGIATAAAWCRSEDIDWLPTGITKAAMIVAGAERLLEEQVMIARADGKSWREVGLCMGVNASSAHRWAARRGIDERADSERQRRKAWAAAHRG